MSDTPAPPRDLQLAFDVGHSSIGWAVLQAAAGKSPELLGCGTVIFQADDCLASQRRGYRRQRRHIRATRLRIARIKALLAHLDALTTTQLDQNACAWPWLLAARVLRGGKLLTWAELWSVLRWYAHNRGYDGNKAWSRHEADMAAAKEDAEKVKNAHALYTEYGTETMAETWCAICGLDPLGDKKSCAMPGDKRPKARNAAFPREDIEREVRNILERHREKLSKLDDTFITTLMQDWQAIPCPAIRLPARFRGGLLFGQLVPRFENRIIARCPITFERIYQQVLKESGDEEKAKHEAEKQAKVPATDCPEFFRYRWAMQVANVLIQTGDGKTSRRLSADERRALDIRMRVRGALTKGEFKDAVEELTGKALSNVKQMLLHPDADKALVVDRAQRELSHKNIASYFAVLPERLQKRIRGQLRRGTGFKLADFRRQLAELGDVSAFDAAVDREVEGLETKRSKTTKPVTREEILGRIVKIEPASGRAPHSREVMREVDQFVFSTDRHPADKDGPLYRSEAIRNAQLQRAIDEQTNNHLVRHRLKILERLHEDILKTYAGATTGKVAKITIEVNRDLRELSGKTAKQVAQDMGLRLSNFKSVTAKLEERLAGQGIRITPGLIRKARIAEDLGWTCPYTGKAYDVLDLIHRRVDKDHVVPRSERASDSLDSLVITFASVNKMKGKRTAALFVEQEQGKPVRDEPQLSIRPLSTYTKLVEGLEAFKGHDDDVRRKKNRKRLLLLRDYVEKEFTPRDLTQTSQLVRLGAQALERHYLADTEKPVITSLPGSVTGTVRKAWNTLGCLSAANPQVLDPATGELRTKTEIRDITHLHHALDACTLAFASLFLPRDGGSWELLVKRRLNPDEQGRARQYFKKYVEFDTDGTLRLVPLPESLLNQIRARLKERRVVQHIPAETRGLRAELNAWRVDRIEEGEAHLHQRIRQPDGTRPLKQRKEKLGKLIGLSPGKLHRLKAALVVGDNYGLALDPEPEIIPFHKVWVRLQQLRTKNDGKPVRVLRNGMLVAVPHGKFSGIWRVFSVKNNASGMALDMGRADVVRLQNKTEGHKINVLLKGLLRDGLEAREGDLVGLTTTTAT